MANFSVNFFFLPPVRLLAHTSLWHAGVYTSKAISWGTVNPLVWNVPHKHNQDQWMALVCPIKKKAPTFLPPQALSCFPLPIAVVLPPLPSPARASSCWLNFLDDARVHVLGLCRWSFWMNECPLPSPSLVLRDIYKSRSPVQLAEFHGKPRRNREIERCETENKAEFEAFFLTKMSEQCS